MPLQSAAFDDFVDDCFLGEDPLCSKGKEDALELVASRLITEILLEEESIPMEALKL